MRPPSRAGVGAPGGKHVIVASWPERINPGDAEQTIARVVKVVGAQDAETCILAVAHTAFRGRWADAIVRPAKHGATPGMIVDLKSVVDRRTVEAAGVVHRAL